MPLPESTNQPAAQPAPAKASTQKTTVVDRGSGVSETGDLTAQVDFYSDLSPARVGPEDNDPNVDWRGPEEGDGELLEGGEDEGGTDGEGSAEEEAGEVGEEEEAVGEGEGTEEGGADEDPLDAEGRDKAEKGKKTATLTIGEKDYNVPVDAVIPTIVNGEVENPTLQELRDAYSSKSNIRKELEVAKTEKQELATKRRQMLRDVEKKEVAVLEKEHSVSRAHRALDSGDYETALNELFGYDHAKWDRFDELMSQYYSEFAKLPQDKIRVIQLDRQNKLAEARQHRANEAGELQRAIDAFNQHKKDRCEQAELTEEDVEDAWDGIVARANKGEYTAAQVEWLKKATPEQKWDTATTEAIATKTRGKITEVIKGKFPKLENKTANIIKELEEKLSGKYLMKASKEDIAGIIAREYNDGKQGAKSPGDKVAPTNSLRDKAQPRHKTREAATLDDDDIYAQDKGGEPTSQVWGGQFQSRPY